MRLRLICTVLSFVTLGAMGHAFSDETSLARPDIPPLSPTRLTEAKQAHEIGQASALMKTTGFHHLKDAASLLRPLADSGNPVAQMELGSIYADPGSGTLLDPKEAVILYKSSAQQGYGPAEVALGKAYRLGEGTEVNKEEATYWYRQAAQQKNPTGQALYGVALLLGDGCKKDVEAGSALLDEAALTDSATGIMVSMFKMQLAHLDSSSAAQEDNIVSTATLIFQ